MSIITLRRPSNIIDVEKEFRFYKHAIPEHEPIKLSDGSWLHTYRVTKYNLDYAGGDIDEEQEAFDREMY